MNTAISAIALRRQRDSSGCFAPGRILTAEEKREKNRIRQARWNGENKERRLAIAAKERNKNKARYDAWYADRPAYKYEHKQAALRAQAGRPRPTVCEIPGCGRTDEIHFDHDHKTKKFRGWICQGCNKALGYVKDDPARLRMLAEYLERASVIQGD